MAGKQRLTKQQREMADKVVQLADGYAAMERGRWDWPDHKPHLDSNGMPVVNKKALLRSVYQEDNDKGYMIFDPDSSHWAAKLFQEQLVIARMRYDLGVRQELEALQPTYKAMGRAFLLELCVRFKAAPGLFPIEFLAKFGALYTRLGAELEGDLPVPGTTQQTLVIALGEMSKELPPNVMEQVRSRLGAKLGESFKALELVSGNGK